MEDEFAYLDQFDYDAYVAEQERFCNQMLDAMEEERDNAYMIREN